MFSVRYYVMAAVLVFLGKVAFAGVLIEPYVGYSLAGKMEDTSGGITQKWDYSGLNLGGRLGAQYLGLMGGLAYDHGSYTTTYKAPSSVIDLLNSFDAGLDTKWSVNSYGAFVGYNFPILLRVWGTYFINSDWKATESKGGRLKDDKMKASAYELGLGYTALPFLSLNVQYRVTNFDKIEYSNGDSTDKYKDKSAKSFILGVSLPINL